MEYLCHISQPVADFEIPIMKLPIWKRSTDLLCCLLAIPFLAIGALCMFAITTVFSPGPILYKQVRIGYQGRRYKIYKFRTMHVAADTGVHQTYLKELIETNAPMTKLDAKGDKRLIPFGWLLRATGLDELPQIINVFKGDMSMVGPRPCLPAEFEAYLPWQRERTNAKPGLTGLWQVSGKNRTTFEEMIRLDISYVTRLTFGQDLKIMLLTPMALLQQVGDILIDRNGPKRAKAAKAFALARGRAETTTKS
jgi:exopolysaccharide production protein ExoY